MIIDIGAPAFFCFAAIILFAFWTLLDQAIAGPNRIGELLRNEIMAALSAIGICCFSFFVLAFDTTWFGKAVATALGILAVITHAFLEPQEASFWHRKRIRSIFIFSTIAISSLMAYFVPRPFLLPVLFAAFVYHRHRQCMLESMSTSLTDLEAVKSKVMTYEAERRVFLKQKQVKHPQPANQNKSHKIENSLQSTPNSLAS